MRLADLPVTDSQQPGCSKEKKLACSLPLRVLLASDGSQIGPILNLVVGYSSQALHVVNVAEIEPQDGMKQACEGLRGVTLSLSLPLTFYLDEVYHIVARTVSPTSSVSSLTNSQRWKDIQAWCGGKTHLPLEEGILQPGLQSLEMVFTGVMLLSYLIVRSHCDFPIVHQVTLRLTAHPTDIALS